MKDSKHKVHLPIISKAFNESQYFKLAKHDSWATSFTKEGLEMTLTVLETTSKINLFILLYFCEEVVMVKLLTWSLIYGAGVGCKICS